MYSFLEYLVAILHLAYVLLVYTVNVLVQFGFVTELLLTSWTILNFILILPMVLVPVISECEVTFPLVVTFVALVALFATMALVHVLVQ